jgi:hypothetical protein
MNHFHLLDALINDDDYSLLLHWELLQENIKKEVIGVIDFFLFFLNKIR